MNFKGFTGDFLNIAHRGGESDRDDSPSEENDTLFCECEAVSCLDICEQLALGFSPEKIQSLLRIGSGCSSCLKPFDGNIVEAIEYIKNMKCGGRDYGI
jgi:bacterioferritin-associated ferredoxin